MRKTKLKTIIVDDEPLARANLSTLLGRDPDIEIMAECKSGAEAVEKVIHLQPDLLFLDVEMPGLDGFDVLEQLGVALPRVVVFVTAYDQYAVKAFEAEALDYILKPFSTQRFEKVLERAKGVLRDQESGARRILVKNAGRATFLRLDEIDWIEAADYYACIHVGNKSHLIRRTLTDLEFQLGKDQFVRVHRSAIVNLLRVQSITPDANGDSEIILASGAQVRLSRGYREQLQQRMKEVLST